MSLGSLRRIGEYHRSTEDLQERFLAGFSLASLPTLADLRIHGIQPQRDGSIRLDGYFPHTIPNELKDDYTAQIVVSITKRADKLSMEAYLGVFEIGEASLTSSQTAKTTLTPAMAKALESAIVKYKDKLGVGAFAASVRAQAAKA